MKPLRPARYCPCNSRKDAGGIYVTYTPPAAADYVKT